MGLSIAILAFGVLVVFVFVVLIFKIPTPTDFQYTVLRILLAVACAAIATALTGFLEVQVQVPITIKAGGALAVFVIVYFGAPAALGSREKTIVDKKFEVGVRVNVRLAGQRDIEIPGKGIIAWTPPMAKYRGHSAVIAAVEQVFDSETVFRITVDATTHQWHASWLELA